MLTLREVACNARIKILQMKNKSKSSHIGSAFSVLDLLVYLYFEYLNIKRENLNDNNRDRLILSKGHSSAAIYTVLAFKEFLDMDKLDYYYCNDGMLPGHVDMNISEALDLSSGSLGHGLPVAAGMALAMKINKVANNIIVIMGDGELNEGSVWEAAMFISREKLNNIRIVIDYNGLQGYELSDEILSYNKMINMWKSLEFYVIEIDGHDFNEMREAFSYKTDLPIVIIAKTIKGKGVSFMENKLEWHYKSPNDEEVILGIKELIRNGL